MYRIITDHRRSAVVPPQRCILLSARNTYAISNFSNFNDHEIYRRIDGHMGTSEISFGEKVENYTSRSNIPCFYNSMISILLLISNVFVFDVFLFPRGITCSTSHVHTCARTVKCIIVSTTMKHYFDYFNIDVTL